MPKPQSVNDNIVRLFDDGEPDLPELPLDVVPASRSAPASMTSIRLLI